MSDPYLPPPPPYQQSPENDQNITESLQQAELSKKTPIHDNSQHADWESTRESIALQNKALMEASERPLRAEKLPPLPSGRGLRGPRPLPPRPVHSKPQSAQGSEPPRLKSILEAKMHEERAEEHLPPPPPPFTPVAPSLDGPPYQEVVDTSNPFLPQSGSHHSLFDIPRHNRRPHTSHSTTETSLPKHNSSSPSQGNTKAQSRSRARLAFDPSVAYSLNDQWNNINESRAANPTLLYSSAVSSHVHHTTLGPGSLYPYVSGRTSAYSRPSPFSSNGTTLTQSATRPISLQSTSSLPISSPSSTHLPCLSSPSAAAARHARWAASESDISLDIYRD